ncbi:lipopolysaccharide export LptBFGC system permease protein LptF [Rhizobium sp. BK049]|uniref:hypothetical protein n=1 Tax=Rhizobium sp. BK049 TaxID=2587095 RepID=UPI00161A31D6|nr:hypothetical protein [Rhizobium sp. BK049]MBB3356026.1 lipopolysaccharide export LptBFGC system permease protein LptF [Rhizobium sp. BK049]
MPSSSHPAVVIGEIAAIIAIVLLGCLAYDTVAGALGFTSGAFCIGLGYACSGAYAIGAVCIMLGLMMWAMTLFRSPSGVALMVSGFLLVIFPPLIPHYLGVSCFAG